MAAMNSVKMVPSGKTNEQRIVLSGLQVPIDLVCD